jgi:tetratricopeptide (TPR) repeat protein
MTVQRGELLYQQSRYDLAETELRQALGAEPGDAYAHALLALTLIQRKQLDDATSEAQQAIHLAPDYAFAHYALAKVWYERDHYDKARAAIEEAIRLDPDDADYRFLLSAMHYDERRWQESLRVAEEGLALDAEHGGCTNLRAMALVKLGRASEAGATIDSALERDPENAATHANKGWALLERGKADEALGHFREALRLSPHNEWARQGIVQALKARNPVYAVMLRYFLFMAKLSQRAQWGVILGVYFANRLVTQAARSDPSLAPWLLPLRILFGVFVLLTWTAEPLFNLLLRVNKFGRLALSRDQIVESNWIGAVMLLGLLSLGAYLALGQSEPLLLAAMVFGFLILPLAGTFNTPLGWPRTAMWTYTSVLAVLGMATIVTTSLTARSGEGANVGIFILLVLGAILSSWVANFLSSRRVKR